MCKRKYTTEFKEQAVKLSYTSEQSVQQVATDLGIAANMPQRKSFTRIAIDEMSCISSLEAQPKQAMCSSATSGSPSASSL